MDQIIMEPIGYINSPYKKPSDVPHQSQYSQNVEAHIELKKEYQIGLQDLDGFSHAIILFYFHQSKKKHLQAVPYSGTKKRGIFAIRSPHRPNHIGCSIVCIKHIQDHRVYFTGVDMINGTPVLDIKPYIPQIDHKNNVEIGWLTDRILQNRQD